MAAPGTSPSPLLDFKQPFNVELLDATIKAFYGAGSNQEVRQLLTSQHRLRTLFASYHDSISSRRIAN